jgi:hypothetical protein
MLEKEMEMVVLFLGALIKGQEEIVKVVS